MKLVIGAAAVLIWFTCVMVDTVDAGTDPVSSVTFAPILAGQTSLDPAEFTTLIIDGADWHAEYRRAHGGWFYNADGVWTPGFPNPLCTDGRWVEDWSTVVYVSTFDGRSAARGMALGVLDGGGASTGRQHTDPTGATLCPTVDLFDLLASSALVGDGLLERMTRAELISHYTAVSP